MTPIVKLLTVMRSRYGPELITNGTFDSGTTGWAAGFGTATSTFAASGGVATLTQAGADTTPRYSIAVTGLVVGRVYRISGQVTSATVACDKLFVWTSASNGTGGTNLFQAQFPSGTYTQSLSATATTMYFTVAMSSATAGATLAVDNISVKAVR